MKTIPVSVRLNEADTEFLSNLKMAGATTPSEKIRELIHAERDRMDRNRTQDAIRSRMQERVNETRNMLKSAERKEGLSSMLWVRVLEVFPDIAAKVLTGDPVRHNHDKNSLLEFEHELQRDVFEMMNEILDLALRQSPRVLNQDAFQDEIQRTLEVLELIQVKQSQLNKGE